MFGLLFRIGVRSNLSEKSSEAHSHTQHTYGIPMPNKGNMSLLSLMPSVYISIPQTVTKDTHTHTIDKRFTYFVLLETRTDRRFVVD